MTSASVVTLGQASPKLLYLLSHDIGLMAEGSEEVSEEIRMEIIESVLQTSEYRMYEEYLRNECGFEQSENRTKVREVNFEGNTPKHIVTFSFDDGRDDTRVELNIMLQEDNVVSSLATIEYLDGIKITDIDTCYVEDGEIVSKFTKIETDGGSEIDEESETDEVSQSVDFSSCKECIILYRTAQKIMRNDVKTVANLSTGFLVAVARQSLTEQLGASTARNSSQIAIKVINYIQQNGISEPPQSVCTNLGYCS